MNIEQLLPEEFKSWNCVDVQRTCITQERMLEILKHIYDWGYEDGYEDGIHVAPSLDKS